MSTFRLWARLYRSSLRVLPGELRTKHGASMEALFARDMHRAEEQGSEVRIAIAAIWDLLARGSYERARSVLRADSPATPGGHRASFANVPGPSVLLRRLMKAYFFIFAGLIACFAALVAHQQFRADRYGGGQLLDFIGLSLPFIAALAAPMSVFLSVLVVMYEVATAPASSGSQNSRGFYSALLVPILLFSGTIGVASFGLMTEVVPRTNARLASVMAGRAVAQSDRSMTLAELEARHRKLLSQVQQYRTALSQEIAPSQPSERIGPYEAEIRTDRRNFLATEIRDAETLVAANAVEIHKKYALAAACVVLALVALALAPRHTRGGAPQFVASSVSVFSFYYICLMAGESLADQLVISPFHAMWAANEFMLFGAILILSHRLRSQRSSQADRTPLHVSQ